MSVSGEESSAISSLQQYLDASMVDKISDDEEDRALSQNATPEAEERASVSPKPVPMKKTISYVGDADDDDDSAEEDVADLNESFERSRNTSDRRISLESSLNEETATLLSRSVRNLSSEDIRLPPEPPGKCSNKLQDKIIHLYEQMLAGKDMKALIQNKKQFRNPCIYEKLIELCNIQEMGTNFPTEAYNPSVFGKDSHYEELRVAQQNEMEKRAKERKDRTKVEFVTGTKSTTKPLTDPQPGEKRKSRFEPQLASTTSAAASDKGPKSSSSSSASRHRSKH